MYNFYFYYLGNPNQTASKMSTMPAKSSINANILFDFLSLVIDINTNKIPRSIENTITKNPILVFPFYGDYLFVPTCNFSIMGSSYNSCIESRLSSKSKFIHFLLLSTSKDAVGSSHKINLGLIMIVLAKTVLAFSPPDFP